MGIYDISQRICATLLLAGIFAFSALNIFASKSEFSDIMSESYKPGEIVEQIEKCTSENIAGKAQLIEIYAWIQVLLGKKESGRFYLLKRQDGSLVYGDWHPQQVGEMREYALCISNLQQSFSESGCKVMFLNVPSRYSPDGNPGEAGYPMRDDNPRQDALLYYLHGYGVDYLDTRVTLEKYNLDTYHYSTDHHWTIPTSFAATIDIIDFFRQKYSVELDSENMFCNPENYYSRTYPQSFLGSMGKRTGATFSGLDDFTVIWPKFNSYYQVETIGTSGRLIRNGPCEESLMSFSVLENDNIYQSIPYNVYFGGVKSYAKIINPNSKNSLKLLLIHDSYSTPTAVFLAPMFSEIHMLWAAAEHNKIDVEEYLSHNDFDYIIVQLYPGNLNGEVIDFFKSEEAAS